jgi:glycosyltransferase involved in cell wall biosynthesis
MPVRNGARWLDEAISSIQDQTLSDFEFIIVDDGSTDDTPRILEAKSKSDPRIRTHRQGRLGLVAALNRGLAEASAPLIARLDADDRACPQRLQRQSRYLDAHPDVGLLSTWADKIDMQGAVIGALKPPTQPDVLAQLLNRTNPLLHSSIMMRKSIVQKVGSYRTAFEGAEDYDLWMRMSEVAQIAVLPECLLQYRVYPASVTNRARLRQLFSTRLAQRAAEMRRAEGRRRRRTGRPGIL